LAIVRARGYRFVSAQECWEQAPNPPLPYVDKCNHPPQTCAFGGRCSFNVSCCEAGTCCSADGNCAATTTQCSTAVCVNGMCSDCPVPAWLADPVYPASSGAYVANASIANYPDCVGSSGTTSCLYDPLKCGRCFDIGVIDHCMSPGKVHISINDGPYLSLIMDALRTASVPASIWLIGNQLNGRGPLIQRMIADGHYVGSASWSFPHVNNLTADDLLQTQLIRTVAAISSVSGVGTKGFRPPYGELNNIVRSTAQQFGYQIVFWNLDSGDYRGDLTTTLTNIRVVLSQSSPATSSFILLMTSTSLASVLAIPSVVSTIKDAGYSIASAKDCWGATETTLGGVSSAARMIPTAASLLLPLIYLFTLIS